LSKTKSREIIFKNKEIQISIKTIVENQVVVQGHVIDLTTFSYSLNPLLFSQM